MPELMGLAFLLAVRGKDKKLKKDELLWLLDCQIEHLENLDVLNTIREGKNELG